MATEKLSILGRKPPKIPKKRVDTFPNTTDRREKKTELPNERILGADKGLEADVSV